MAGVLVAVAIAQVDGLSVRALRSGREIARPQVSASGGIYSVAFSPDGSRFVAAGRDGVIRVYDDRFELLGHNSYSWSLAWSSDSSTLISGSGDYTVRVWRAPSESSR